MPPAAFLSRCGYRPCSLWEGASEEFFLDEEEFQTIDGDPADTELDAAGACTAQTSRSMTAAVPQTQCLCPDAMKFLAGVKAAGKFLPTKNWLLDFTEQGFHPGLITRAEDLFEGHPDLLVAFNMFLPEGGKCTVPE